MFINDGKLLGIYNAVEMAAMKMKLTKKYVKVNIGFGEIILRPVRTTDPMDPLFEVDRFDQAPISCKAVQDNIRNGFVKYYAEIPFNISISLETLEHEIGLALMKVLLIHITGEHSGSLINNEFVVAVYDAYRSQFYTWAGTSDCFDQYVEEMVVSKNIMSLINQKQSDIADRLARRYFRNLVNDGQEIVAKAEKSIKTTVNDLQKVFLFDSFQRALLIVSMQIRYEVHFDRPVITNDYAKYVCTRLEDSIGTDQNTPCIYNFFKVLLDQDSKFLSDYKEAERKKSEKKAVADKPVKKGTSGKRSPRKKKEETAAAVSQGE